MQYNKVRSYFITPCIETKGNAGTLRHCSRRIHNKKQPLCITLWLSAVLVVATMSRYLFFSDNIGSKSKNLKMSSTTNFDTSVPQEDELCDFYLAESAIPHGGLGVFTAKPLPKGAPAQPWPDICLYLTNASPQRGTEIASHTWQNYRFGAKWLGASQGTVRAACMGFVTIFNSMGMKEYASVKPTALPHLIHTNGGLDRSKDPGAGAITQYYGASSITLRDLQAGSELMIWDKSHGGNLYRQDTTPEFPGKEYDKDGKAKIVPPVRPPEWLQKHGMCMDNIIVKKASDPTMGRGAYTKRALKKGMVVTPAPLQVYPDRSKFAAPSNPENKDAMFENPEQLFVNYCFQPKNSTLLLYPYGAGIGLINHASDKSKVNVALQWSSHSANHAHQWLDASLSLEQFFKMQYPGSIIVDVVALRDIAKGEEIFMDYGFEWEKAWNDHVKSWKPLHEDRYVYPWHEMKKHGLSAANTININSSGDEIQQKPFRTKREQEANPYPKNLMMVCDTVNRPNGRQRKLTEWAPSKNWPNNLHPCHVLSSYTRREGGKIVYYYDVLLPSKERPRKRYIDRNVPHGAIRFVDKPFQSDQYLSNSFRHPIGFPDALTPPSWRNN